MGDFGGFSGHGGLQKEGGESECEGAQGEGYEGGQTHRVGS
jgi:hypothetical protein